MRLLRHPSLRSGFLALTKVGYTPQNDKSETCLTMTKFKNVVRGFLWVTLASCRTTLKGRTTKGDVPRNDKARLPNKLVNYNVKNQRAE